MPPENKIQDTKQDKPAATKPKSEDTLQTEPQNKTSASDTENKTLVKEVLTESKQEQEMTTKEDQQPPTTIETVTEETPLSSTPSAALGTSEIPTEQITTTPPTLTPTQIKLTPQTPSIQTQTKIVYQIPPNFVQKLLIKARAKIQERKRKKLDKVMSLFETKSQIVNKDIQKLLRISSATAVRYLDILEKENHIKQVGSTGKSVFYTKI